MLAPNSRLLLLDALRPPTGFRIDAAIATTYTLSLDALLIPPAAWALHAAAAGLESVDPILLANSLRLFADRTMVFHQAGASSPFAHGNDQLSAFLDEMVVPLRVGPGETFHPKVWVLRFTSDNGEVGLRVLIGSRNLSLDTTWDVLVSMDSGPKSAEAASGRVLADLLRSLPDRSTVTIPQQRQELLESVVADLDAAYFVPPDGCLGAEILWLSRNRRSSPFPPSCERRLVISPFLGASCLDGLPMPSEGESSILVSRSTSLTADLAAGFTPYTMTTDLGGVDDGSEARLGEELHAKVFAFDGDNGSTLILGSANATGAAFTINDEVIVRLTGPTSSLGVNALLGEAEKEADASDDLELIDLLEPWLPGDELEADGDEDGRFYEDAIRLVASAVLHGECTEHSDDHWEIALWFDQQLDLPDGIGVDLRLLTESSYLSPAVMRAQEARLVVPLEGVTRFVVARFSDLSGRLEALSVVLVADMAVPEGRGRRALRALLTDKDKFARFLRYLLEGVVGSVPGEDPGDVGGGVPQRGRTKRGRMLEDGPILEQLLRLLASQPSELRHVDAVISDFADDGSILPDGFAELWSAIAPLIPKEQE